MKRWCEYWCLPLNPIKCEVSFFSVDPHQAKLQPDLLYSAGASVSIPLQPLSFPKHVSSLKAKFFPRLRALRYISASSWGPSKESLYLLYKDFVRPLLTYASPGWFPFLSVTNITKLERFHRAASRVISSGLSSSPIPLFLSETSLPPLRATLTHFTLSYYERTLGLPTSFTILSLPRFGVKPRLCRSSCTAFASIHTLMFSSTSPRKAILACPPSPPWNLPSFTVESTLSSPCYSSDRTLFRQGAALAYLDSLSPYDLVLWTDGSVLFGKGCSGVLANCSLSLSLSVALRALFPFQQAQYVQVFPLKPAPSARSLLVSAAPTSLPLVISSLSI